MDSGELVAAQIEAGQKLLEAMRRAHIRLSVAMWLSTDETYEWRLMLASSLADRKGPRAAYEQLSKILAAEELSETLPLSRISMVGTNHPTAKAIAQAFKGALKVRRGGGIRIRKSSINGMFLHDAYTYGL